MKSQKIITFKRDEVSIKSASKTLGVSKSSVRRFIHRGWVPFTRRGPALVLKKSAILKIQFAMQVPGPWHTKIQWLPEDMFDFKGTQTVNHAVEIKSESNVGQTFDKPSELFNIARKLKAMGENDLAGQAALKAAEAM